MSGEDRIADLAAEEIRNVLSIADDLAASVNVYRRLITTVETVAGVHDTTIAGEEADRRLAAAEAVREATGVEDLFRALSQLLGWIRDGLDGHRLDQECHTPDELRRRFADYLTGEPAAAS